MRRRRGPSIIVALAAACLLAGCGQVHSDRPAVARYVRRVQRLETALGKPLAAVGKVGSTLQTDAIGDSTTLSRFALASTEGTLSVALRRMTALRAQLAALRAPTAAQHLRLLMLRLVDRQIGLTREVAELARFLPQFTSDLRPLAAATGRLQASLNHSSTIPGGEVGAIYSQRSAALHAFSRDVKGIIVRLARLDPPPVSTPGYRTQMASLRGLSRGADRLAAALSTQQPNQVEPALVSFDRAATLSRTAAAQRAQIAAIRSYDRRVASLRNLVVAIDRERARLDQLLA